jgi:hypothetical protein
LAAAVKKISTYAGSRAMLFVISDFSVFSDVLQKELLSMKAHSEIALIMVEDAVERFPPQKGRYPVRRGSELVILDFDDPTFAGAYAAFFQKRRDDLAAFAARHGMICAMLGTDEDDLLAFRRIFGAGGAR